MKDIPIVILNRDRFYPLKDLINSLHKRNYTNITIIDNGSTFEPLLEWYKTSGIDVFFNNLVRNENGTLYLLSHEAKHPKFVDIIKDYYVFTDSDTIPIEETPDDFIEHLVELCKKYQKHKIGLGLKIDDLPDNELNQEVINHESKFWKNVEYDFSIPPNSGVKLYSSAVDTTFAVYSPNSKALWSKDTFRTGFPYLAKHAPWYYDINSLPEDEQHYIDNLQSGTGPVWSFKLKNSKKV